MAKGESVSRLFDKVQTIGLKELVKLRKDITAPDKVKHHRVWSAKDAAALIGRSTPWLKSHDTDPTVDSRGYRTFSLEKINRIRKKEGLLWKRPEDQPATVLAVQNFKGGVSKTTSAIHIAHRAAMEGLQVLLVDLDPQGSLTYCAGNIVPDLELKPEQLINKALLSDPSDIQYLPVETYFPNVDLIPANLQLQDVEVALANESGAVGTRLLQALEHLTDYDLIVLDCAPNLGYITTNAIVAANALLIPVPPSVLDRASFVLLSHSLHTLFEKTDKAYDWVKVGITKHSDSTHARAQEAEIRRAYGDLVMEAPLFLSAEVEKATTLLSSVYDQTKPINSRDTRIRALETLDAFTGEVMGLIRHSWGQNSD